MEAITIELNGVLRAVPGGHTLRELICSLDLLGKRVAVAINREVVPSPSWASRVLCHADRIEVVVAIGGG